jgi:alpha-1,3-glucosyltransferase
VEFEYGERDRFGGERRKFSTLKKGAPRVALERGGTHRRPPPTRPAARAAMAPRRAAARAAPHATPARAALALAAAAASLKLLLAPGYRSTDFEVHRNWLAITWALPWRAWYADTASIAGSAAAGSPSPWTLDYPPLFAAFERLLASVAHYVDPAMLELNNLDYASPATALFQRASVVAAELPLLAAVWWATRRAPPRRRLLALALVAFHPALLIVDHLHFQYNGLPLAAQVAATAALARGGAAMEALGAALFSAALCLKHLHLYAAPAFFAHLLARCVRGRRPAAALGALARVGAATAAPAAAALGPVLAAGLGAQLAGRLFPVARGLTHAYWAPNFWALYASADLALAAALAAARARLGLFGGPAAAAAAVAAAGGLTRGLVGAGGFAVLPAVGPLGAAAAALAAAAPGLAAAWRAARAPARFPAAAARAALAAFCFGYHVHEKAIIMVIVPLALAAAEGAPPAFGFASSAAEFAFLSTLGTYALFPLLHRPAEAPLRTLLLAAYTAFALPALAAPDAPLLEALGCGGEDDDGAAASGKGKERRRGRAKPLLSRGEAAWLWGLLPLELYCAWGHAALLGGRLPFAPLAATSAYCGAGVVWAWARGAAAAWREARAGGGGGGGAAGAPRRRAAS